MKDVLRADVIVIGGGLGGCMAALAVAKKGLNVIMTEETDWVGGQLTNQAVPPDEHKWIESFGCTSTYREFRNRVRQYYKENYPLKNESKHNDFLNPGNAWVSRLSHEPRVALKVLEDMLAPYVNSGRINILYLYKPLDALLARDDMVESVTVQQISTKENVILKGQYFLDATECGDVLPMAKVEYVTGAESKAETGEPHALEMADPLDMQSITHVFAVEHFEGENFTIKKPDQYEFWSQFIPSFSNNPIFNWSTTDADDTSKMKEFTLFSNDKGIPSLWDYRRIIDPSILEGNLYGSDITLINWAQNDYYLGPIYEVSEEERRHHLEGARQLSLSLLYWLQTEAPRLDGSKGFPGLRLCKHVLGTEDGLAKQPYIRESRRIKAVYTITEKDVSKELRGEKGICRYIDSVGVGSYHLDLHPTTVSNRTFYIPNYPFEIPLGALLPIHVKNLLPACKNIGTTQITNGCYRLHPTEWNIGESAGYLAAYSILNNVLPHDVRADKKHLQSYQSMLEEQGIQLHWPENIVNEL